MLKNHLALLLAACAALLAGCGGGGPSVQEYFDEASAISQQYAAQEEAIRSEDDWPNMTDFNRFGSAVTDGRNALSDAVFAMDELAPPEEAENEHSALVSAGFRQVRAYDDILDELQRGVPTIQGLLAGPLGEELAAAGSAYRLACIALQTVADNYGVLADLACETGLDRDL